MIEELTNRPPGNQPLSQSQIDEIVRQLEPHLKGGYSLRKACLLAEIPKSTVYDLMQRDLDFADKIEVSRQFLAELTSSIVATELMTIRTRQEDGNELTKADRSFVQWFCSNHYTMRESFGQQAEKTFDPLLEIRRITALIEEASNDIEYDAIDQHA